MRVGGRVSGLVAQPPMVLEGRAAEPLADDAREHGRHELVEGGLDSKWP